MDVLTPTVKVAIETLRDGDLVIGGNEETGISGVFPVTAVMSRQALDTLWLALENEAGESSRKRPFSPYSSTATVHQSC
ncbi:hypothetical protein [uncultured Litoreibacter sp.]|uniref:hypothetical protein n=1 Tax=uncultured Litoreibacter sp. TaxID=1392394 RepID=UPI00260CF0F8|nr:hypothetical protein [uncultured Litoreibacter sp.]